MKDLKVFYSWIPFPLARHLFEVGTDRLDWNTGEVTSMGLDIETRLTKMQLLHTDLVRTFDAQMKSSDSPITAADFDVMLKKNLADNGKLQRYLTDVQAYQYANKLPISDGRSDELVLILIQNILLAQLLLLQTVCKNTIKNAPSNLVNDYSFGLVGAWEGYARYQILNTDGAAVCYDISLGDLVEFWPTETWDRFYDYGLKALTDETTSPVHVLNFIYTGIAINKAGQIKELRDMKWPISFTNFKRLSVFLRERS